MRCSQWGGFSSGGGVGSTPGGGRDGSCGLDGSNMWTLDGTCGTAARGTPLSSPIAARDGL